MASLLSLQRATPLTHTKGDHLRRPLVSCSTGGIQCDKRTRVCFEELPLTKRRDMLLRCVCLSVASFPSIAMGASAETDVQESFRIYEDEMNKFRIQVPQDWLVGAGETNAIKSVTAFYPQDGSDSNVSVVITGVGPDFTRLESFGNVDTFAENLVNGLDRSWKRPPGLAAKLINSKAANGLYYMEYTLQNPGERCRHIISAIGMASNGWYNRLYTVSGQFIEDESEKYKSQIEKFHHSDCSEEAIRSQIGDKSVSLNLDKWSPVCAEEVAVKVRAMNAKPT